MILKGREHNKMELYPDNILESLDFELIRNTIARRCSSSEAAAKANGLVPSSNIADVEPELIAVDEWLAWLHSDNSLPSTQFEALKEYAQKLKTPGVMLEEESFSAIRSSLRTYQNISDFMSNHRERFPESIEQLATAPPLPEVIRMIDHVLDERATVLSSASRDLGRIRSQLAKSRSTAARIFERTLKKYRDKDLLADFDETVSENRRVLAIQASFKTRVNGIFHSSSNKGNVVFIEPSETVEVNNEIAELIDDERQEIRRILIKLGKDLRPYASSLGVIHNKLLWLDLLKAKALFAKEEDCCLPRINRKENSVILKEAFNPALKLLNREKGKPTLPLNLTLDADQRILVISGPNAGGKTIAMKTLGLLSIMLQSGIPVPVHPETRMPFFAKIFTDIGDSQSIQNELSTYSSKLVKMKHFLENADHETLLLIDEFGSGSDPELGSTLAQVFLERLNSYGVFGIFTTHYNAIKALASELPGVVNAAMLFNRAKLTPEFRLETGNPGSSYTYEVARQSGIPAHLIDEAKKKTPSNTLNVDQLLVKLQEDKLTLEKKHAGLNSELQKLRELELKHKSAVGKLQEKLDKQTRVNEENDRILYWGQRFQKLVEGWLAQQGKKDKKQVVGRFVGMLNQRASEVKKENIKAEKEQKKLENTRLTKKLKEPVSVGDQVKVLDTGMKGIISEIKKDRYIITIGANITSQLNRNQFIKQVQRKSGSRKRPKGKS
jgi:DNA mismatch repair protein MutS2